LSPFLFAVYVDNLANLCTFSCGLRIVLNADDLLLLVPSISGLESLLNLCECELDMVINNKKSCYICIRPRSNITCAAMSMSTGAIIPWMDEIRYLGVFIVRSWLFKCSLAHAKKSFYRSTNAIFGKVGQLASEEVTLQLIKSKRIPVLLYGLEECPLNKSDLQSLDFVINRFFMKLFRTRVIPHQINTVTRHDHLQSC